MTDNIIKKSSKSYPALHDMQAGLGAGLGVTAIFHPFDRAFYLSQTENRRFFSPANFRRPLQGMIQSLGSRSFSTGCYYILQHQTGEWFNNTINPQLHLTATETAFCTGLVAGTLKGIVCNPLYVIRGRTWSTDGETFLALSKSIWSQGGLRAFTRGSHVTVTGNALFSMFYETSRSKGRERGLTPLVSDMAAGAFAAGCTTHLNYLRNRIYSTPPSLPPPSIQEIFSTLLKESKPYPTLLSKAGFFQRKFLLGYDMTRAGLGVAAGQLVFDTIRKTMDG